MNVRLDVVHIYNVQQAIGILGINYSPIWE